MNALFDSAWSLPLGASACLIAAAIDLRTGHIPNWLTLGALCIGLFLLPAVRLVLGHGTWLQWGLAFVGAGLCALVPLLLFRSGAMGGGDVKLLAAVGALVGPSLGIEVELYSFIAAALWGPARLAYQGELGRMLMNTGRIVRNWVMPKSKRIELHTLSMSELRFAPAIFVGFCAAGAIAMGGTL
jgi:prepilin peptidase CpaA